jgi:hypothetical protein
MTNYLPPSHARPTARITRLSMLIALALVFSCPSRSEALSDAPPGDLPNAQCGFEFIPINLTGCFESSPLLYSMNNSGVAVGSSDWCNPGARKAVRWSLEEGVVLLPLPLGESVAEGINERGTIAGTGYPQGGGNPSQGWIYRDGVYTVIPKPRDGALVVTGILEDDTVYGIAYLNEAPWLRAFAWRNGEFLPVPESLASADLYALPRGGSRGRGSHPGYIVGSVSAPETIPGWQNNDAFRWDITTGEVITQAVELPYFRAEGWTATPDGRIFGRCFTLMEIQGVVKPRFRTLETTEGAPIVFEPIPINDGIWYRDVNDQGHAFGTSLCQSGLCICDGVPCSPWFKQRAILWRNGELIDLLAVAIEQHGSNLAKSGRAINDYGEMIVSGVGPGTYQYLVRSLTPPGDVNFDCSVGRADLMLVLENWGNRLDAAVAASDLDRDGVIGPADLAEVLGGWSAQ